MVPDDTRARPTFADRLYLRLRRITTSGVFIPEIDGLRFIAIALVVLVHIHMYVAIVAGQRFDPPPRFHGPGANPLMQVVQHGGYGVELFFVISGFILALPFAEHFLWGRPPVPLGKYFLRRLTRLEPPYLASLATHFVLTAASRAGSQWTLSQLLVSLAVSCVYVHGLVFGEPSLVHFVAWSLEVEVQFYLLIPLLYLVVPLVAEVLALRKRWARRVVLAAGAFGLVAFCQAIGVDDYPRLRLSILNYGQYLIAGFLLADMYVADWSKQPGRHRAWDLVSLAGWVAVFVLLDLGVWRAYLLPPLILLLCVAMLRGVWFRVALTNRWVVVTGGMCYSLYLVHGVFIVVVGRWTTRLPGPASYEAYFLMQVALLAPIIMAGSAVFFVLIEKPCMRRDWPQTLYRWAKGFGRARKRDDVLPLASES
jgi:peptidoglycan/LPS O-acetylase OafA/YrhL